MAFMPVCQADVVFGVGLAYIFSTMGCDSLMLSYLFFYFLFIHYKLFYLEEEEYMDLTSILEKVDSEMFGI